MGKGVFSCLVLPPGSLAAPFPALQVNKKGGCAAQKPSCILLYLCRVYFKSKRYTGKKLFPCQFWHAWHAATAWFHRTRSAKSMELYIWLCWVNISEGLCSACLSNSLLWFWKNALAFQGAGTNFHRSAGNIDTLLMPLILYHQRLGGGSLWAIMKHVSQHYLFHFPVLNKQQPVPGKEINCLTIEQVSRAGWPLSEQTLGMQVTQIWLRDKL